MDRLEVYEADPNARYSWSSRLVRAGGATEESEERFSRSAYAIHAGALAHPEVPVFVAHGKEWVEIPIAAAVACDIPWSLLPDEGDWDL